MYDRNDQPFRMFVKPSVTPQLPAEMWMMIFKHVESSKDLHSCSQTCNMLHCILDDMKQYWCFDLIIPLILPHLDLQSALTCRLVCEAWKNKFDNFVENAPNYRPYEMGHNRHPLLKDNKLSNKLRKLSEPLNLQKNQIVQRFTQEMQSTKLEGKIPIIIGRSVIIGHLLLIRPHDYWDHILKFLDTAGYEINSLILSENQIRRNRHLDYLHIQLTLNRCPNIRKFEYNLCWVEETLVVDDNVIEIRDIDGRHIGNYILENYPLPSLTHLDSLIFEKSTPICLQVCLITKYARQLKWLEFTLSPEVSHATLQQMTNLIELKVRVSGRIIANSNEVRNLLQIPSRGNVRKLTLELFKTNIELNILLDICEHLSVKALVISGGQKTKLLGSEEQSRRVIMSLKSLHCLDIAGMETFNFLSCFPFLESLHLKGVYEADRKPTIGFNQQVPEVLKIREFLYVVDLETAYRSMYKSNLWTVLPKLQKLWFQYKWKNDRDWQREVFTRDEFNKVPK